MPRGAKITYQGVDLLRIRDPRGDGTFPRRQQGGRVQVEAQFRTYGREAAIGSNDFQARRPRRLREVVDGGVRYTRGPFQQLVHQIPIRAQSIVVGV